MQSRKFKEIEMTRRNCTLSVRPSVCLSVHPTGSGRDGVCLLRLTRVPVRPANFYLSRKMESKQLFHVRFFSSSIPTVHYRLVLR